MIVLAALAVVAAGVAGYAFRGKEKKLIAAAASEVVKLEAEGVTDAKTALARVKAALHI